MAIEGHNNLIQAGTSKEEADKTMAEFMENIQSREPDWEEDIAHGDESDKDAEVSSEDGQFEISSDEEFEEEDEEGEGSEGRAENPIMLDQ